MKIKGIEFSEETINALKALGFTFEEPKPRLYNRGQRFKIYESGPEYILANTGFNEVMMINTDKYGIAVFSSKTTVGNVDTITEAEFKQICCGGNFFLCEANK